MIFLTFAETSEATLPERLGKPDYSYHFVLTAFRPVLERIGAVFDLSGMEDHERQRRVAAIDSIARAGGERCVFVSFTPPHRTPLGMACPTVCVFAWEFEDLPGTGADRPGDWRHVLRSVGQAITHSAHTAALVRRTMGEDVDIAAIPAPVWDDFARPDGEPTPPPRAEALILEFSGDVFEPGRPTVVEAIGVEAIGGEAATTPPGALRGKATIELDVSSTAPPRPTATRRLELEGIVYTVVFNPEDGRKNWLEIVRCFVMALRARSDAVLVLKVIGVLSPERTRKHLGRVLDLLGPHACRVVLIEAHLDAAAYRRLMTGTTYAVSGSHGEGQCLPLMESMSAGRPALAPPHTGMADYVDATDAFPIPSSLEPAQFPHERGARFRTWRHRIDARALHDAFRESYRIAREDPDRYSALSRAARDRLHGHCSRDTCETRLRDFFSRELRPSPVTEQGARIEEEIRAGARRREEQYFTTIWNRKARRQPRMIAEFPFPTEESTGIDLRFVLPGFAKCGTTTLSAALGRHPALHVPIRESWYFVQILDGTDRSPDALSEFFEGARPDDILGLCGVTYTSIEDEAIACRALAAYSPDVKLLFLARDPLARIESAFREAHHSWEKLAAPPPPFSLEEALEELPELLEDSRYGARMQCWFDHFSPDQIRVVFLEELLRDPVATLRECFRFLDVDPDVPIPAELPRLNPSSEKVRDEPIVRRLYDPDECPEASVALRAIRRRDRESLLRALGWRRPWEGPLDGWDTSVQRRVARELEEDAREFLASHGRTFELWPRFQSLLSSLD